MCSHIHCWWCCWCWWCCLCGVTCCCGWWLLLLLGGQARWRWATGQRTPARARPQPEPSPTVVSAHTPHPATPPSEDQPPATLAWSRKKTSKSEQTFQMSTSLAIVNQTFVNIYLSGLVPTHSQQCTAPTGHQSHTLNLDTGGSLKLKRKFGNLSK